VERLRKALAAEVLAGPAEEDFPQFAGGGTALRVVQPAAVDGQRDPAIHQVGRFRVRRKGRENPLEQGNDVSLPRFAVDVPDIVVGHDVNSLSCGNGNPPPSMIGDREADGGLPLFQVVPAITNVILAGP
jgi:hypothetical protein